jgi:hypothetical protein
MAEHQRGGRRGAVVVERLLYDPVSWDAIVERYPDPEVFHSSECTGFLLEQEADRRAATEALVPFAFGALGCFHVDLGDRRLTAEMMACSGYQVETGRTLVVDLTSPEEVILGRMRSTTRNYIRQAVRRGLRAEITGDLAFADEYQEQLSDVFARQGLVPTYDAERVRQLIQALHGVRASSCSCASARRTEPVWRPQWWSGATGQPSSGARPSFARMPGSIRTSFSIGKRCATGAPAAPCGTTWVAVATRRRSSAGQRRRPFVFTAHGVRGCGTGGRRSVVS